MLVQTHPEYGRRTAPHRTPALGKWESLAEASELGGLVASPGPFGVYTLRRGRAVRACRSGRIVGWILPERHRGWRVNDEHWVRSRVLGADRTTGSRDMCGGRAGVGRLRAIGRLEEVGTPSFPNR